MTRPLILMLGHGYSAAALAARLADWRILGTTRSEARAEEMRGFGVEPVAWEDRSAIDEAIGAARAILVSLPPDTDGDPALRRHREALAAARPEWVGYLSTTGVYGDRGGAWVDETDALLPVGERGRRRVAAEAEWAATGLPVHLFRLAGIYGPGRSVLDRLRAGTAQRVVRAGQVFSRIHVEDVAATLAASLARPAPGRAYNVADDEPAASADVVAFGAGLLGLPVPPEVPFEETDLSPMARSFWADFKRVSNRRIRKELGVRLACPDYRAGLRAVLAAGG